MSTPVRFSVPAARVRALRRAPVPAVLALALGAFTAAVHAAGPMPYNTGVGAGGVALGSNAVDPHYSIVGSPAFGPSAFVKTQADGPPIEPGGWLLDSPASAWITPSTTCFFIDVPGVTDQITYRTTFDLAGYIPTGGSLAGRWAADDSGLQIRLNGNVVAGVGVAQFDVWTPFSIGSGFVEGLNTLEFTTLSTQSPTGLRVEFTSSNFTAVVPEPGSGAMLAAGLLGLVSVARRRAAAAV
jgi:hypothetical protein